MKDKYTDERIFILGNGPSLNETDLSRLTSEYTLAMNKVSKLYDDTSWRPSFYYNALPPSHALIPQDLDIILRNVTNRTVCFLNENWHEEVRQDTNFFSFERWSLFGSPFDHIGRDEIQQKPIEYLFEFWSDNVESIVYHYHSMYGAVQLAVWLGFDKIYFLGCDLGMEYDNPHMVFQSGLDPHRFEGTKIEYIRRSLGHRPVQSIVNAIAMKIIKSDYQSDILNNLLYKGRNDHFTEEYFEELVIQDSVRHEKEIKKGHLVCKRICNHKNIEIKNATIGGDLEIYDRVDLSSLV